MRRLALVFAGLGVPLLMADELLVTNIDDAGPGSLREVVSSALGGDEIVFDPILNGQMITLTSGEILLSDELTIDATALSDGLSLSGNFSSRIFTVLPTANVALRGLTLMNGRATLETFPGNSGGAIRLRGIMIAEDCTFSNNLAGSGGAIRSDSGSLDLVNCTLSDNFSTLDSGVIFSNGTINAVNSTFSGNGSNGFGAVIFSQAGSCSLTYVTIAGNSGAQAIGNEADLILKNSIVIGANSRADITNEGNGFIDLEGVNLLSTVNRSGLTDDPDTTSDGLLLTSDARLAPLGNYGGSIRTRALFENSPAIGVAVSDPQVPMDQRGEPRSDSPDIGAYEGSISLPGTVVTSAESSGVGSLTLVLSAALPGAEITFDPSLSGERIVLEQETIVNDELTIDGSSLPEPVEIMGNGRSRLFFVGENGELVLDSLHLTGGRATQEQFPANSGGAIFARGSVVLEQCLLSGHEAGSGGAIRCESGFVIMDRCTLSENFASIDSGAVFVNGTVQMSNCTLVENSTNGAGGAIWNFQGDLTIDHCTFSGNQDGNGANAIFERGVTEVNNSVFIGASDDSGSTIFVRNNGMLTLTGVNFFTNLNGTGLVDGPGIDDHILIDSRPRLAALGLYGGKTPTRPPLFDSPVIDQAVDTELTTDQRGGARPTGTGIDLGAVEFDPTLDGEGYPAWAMNNIPAGQDRSFDGDADEDGLGNGVEYALGTNPASALNDLRLVPALGRLSMDGELSFSFGAQRKKADVMITIERGDDLRGWLPMVVISGANVLAFPGAGPSGFLSDERFEVQFPILPGREFQRIRVSLIP